MRLVIDGRLILPHPTGIGRYLLELIPPLASAAAGSSIEVWLQSRLPGEHPAWTLARPSSTAAASIALHRVDYAHMSPHGWLRFPFDLHRRPFDLLHYPHFDLPVGVPGKVVITLHDLKYLARRGLITRQPRLRRFLFQKMASAAVRRAENVICVSHTTAADAARFLNADPARLQVAHLGVAERFFNTTSAAEQDQFRLRYRLLNDYLLFVGERRPHKNLVGLIQAYHLFQLQASRSYNLLIVGRPYPGYSAPEKMVETLGLTDRVQFLDWIDDADLPALYHSASAFVLLSYYEGFGLPALEAMACGVPVIAADRAALPEVCASAAVLVPPDDHEAAAQALFDVLSNPEAGASLASRGRIQARSFTWEHCARKTLEVYRSTLA